MQRHLNRFAAGGRLRQGQLLAALLVLAGAAGATFAQQQSLIVCWNDDRGQRTCGDHVPPQYAHKQRDLYDSAGSLVKVLPAEATAEERAARERQEASEKAAQEQAAHDLFLLQTYRNVSDLESERDGRLGQLDMKLQLAEKAVVDDQNALNDLRSRTGSAGGSSGSTAAVADAGLQRQIESYENSQSDNMNAVNLLKQKRASTAAQYERDIERYLALRNQPAAVSR